ncbi:hypothetical protein NLI96_g8577 [Meripilus lineatus]|uniref:Uncharacterized protein n=1 Tax=Meripilus lineatus TaxID=2056292 RepID=A0AAD5UZC3_9APHY|nr:hypothetical protein NLI96_g8577 [Physisporinus lineatus]
MSDTRRWSELIPPRTALTFAAMWDPVEGIITFSGGKLLESDLLEQIDSRLQLGDSPRDACDSQSQVLTIDRLALALAGPSGPGTAPPNSAFLALEQSRGPVTFRCEALDGADSAIDPYFQTAWGRYTPAQTIIFRTTDSEEEDSHGLDTPKGEHWPHLKHFGKQILSAAKTPFDGRIFHKAAGSPTSSTSTDSDSSDEYFEEAVMTANRSSFYSAPMLVNLNLTPSPPPPPPVSYDAPADPAEVLAREAYNHIYPRSPPGLMIRKQKSFAKAKEFLDKLTLNKKKTDESWVCVEVTHKVTQHVISEGSVGPARCGGR